MVSCRVAFVSRPENPKTRGACCFWLSFPASPTGVLKKRHPKRNLPVTCQGLIFSLQHLTIARFAVYPCGLPSLSLQTGRALLAFTPPQPSLRFRASNSGPGPTREMQRGTRWDDGNLEGSPSPVVSCTSRAQSESTFGPFDLLILPPRAILLFLDQQRGSSTWAQSFWTFNFGSSRKNATLKKS